MWKSIVLCVSLFGGAALGLALGAPFVEPAALPAAAAIGLCVIGIVLILAAPSTKTDTAVVSQHDTVAETVELPTVAAAAPVTNRTPTMPFQAVQP